MIDKIKETILPTPEQRFNKFVERHRKTIPERYNQIRLMDVLTDRNVDHYISISNRSDGKSYNYKSIIVKMAIEYGIHFTFLVRHYTVRRAEQNLLRKLLDESDDYNPKDFIFMNDNFYDTLFYKDHPIGIITDLNQATDLKYESNFLQDFPMIVYDEFLALEGDYLMDEWERIKTVYGSINRGQEVNIIQHPKLLYLGNAVNFSSPVLSNLNLFNILEKHPMNTMNIYDNIALEFNKNDNANEVRNLRAFKEEDDAMTNAEFYINKHNIATGYDRDNINLKPSYIIVKLKMFYLKITYNVDTYESILSVVNSSNEYDFNTEIKDNTEKSIYLDDSYYSDRQLKKYNKDVYLFDNMYSKDSILEGFNNLRELQINKIIKVHDANNTKDNFEKREEIYKENYIDNTKKSLHKAFFQ